LGETHCLVAVVVCFVALPQAATQRTAQEARASALSTTPP
jgi:hypothetical protein